MEKEGLGNCSGRIAEGHGSLDGTCAGHDICNNFQNKIHCQHAQDIYARTGEYSPTGAAADIAGNLIQVGGVGLGDLTHDAISHELSECQWRPTRGAGLGRRLCGRVERS